MIILGSHEKFKSLVDATRIPISTKGQWVKNEFWHTNFC